MDRRYVKTLVLFDTPLEAVLVRCSASGRVSQEEAERVWWAFEKSKPTRAELETLGFDWAYVLRDRTQPARSDRPQPRVAQPPSGWRAVPAAARP